MDIGGREPTDTALGKNVAGLSNALRADEQPAGVDARVVRAAA
jgi:hypothetical protein